MKKTTLLFLTLFLFFELSFTQCYDPFENWSNTHVASGIDLTGEDGHTYPQLGNSTFTCDKFVSIRFWFKLNPDENPLTEFINWQDISHFEIDFGFFDTLTGDYVEHIIHVSKSELEYTNTAHSGEAMYYFRNFSNPFITSLSQNGIITTLSVKIRAALTSYGIIGPTSNNALVNEDSSTCGTFQFQICELAQDSDQDGIIDNLDNCPSVPNTDQNDNDSDGIGNSCDNCINSSNPDQIDSDNDGLGNACDNDDDNDGVLDNNDNCHVDVNPNQEDSDTDGVGDICDNCPQTANPNQEDSDGNGIGDACQIDPDLTVSTNDVLILSDCLDCPFILSDLDIDEKYKITPNSSLTIQSAIIQNMTSAGAPASKVKYAISPDLSSNEPSDDFDLPYETSIPSILGNSSYTFSEVISGADFPALTFGNYKIIVKIDADNNVEEGTGEDNNKIVIPIKWTNSVSGRFYLNLGANTLEFETDDFQQSFNGTINLKIYSLNGLIGIDGNQSTNTSNNNQPLINQQISENQTIDISYLAAGTYAIHINDVYLQKFNKKR
ncbi:thrombospondin type 3 repeat-containing protein [Winogradskyella sp.]|uniref:thrombospondin type 3 repeat-containing protein n=1 Tax=Winogradskyella sp. TaxID=1883156 RepID=UPI003BA8FBBC